MNDSTLTITASPAENASVLRLCGPVVLQNLFELRDAIRAQDAPLVVLDLTDVPFMDSAALGCIVNAHVSSLHRGRALALAGVCERVATLLHVTKVDHVLTVRPTLSEALQSAQSQTS